MKYYRYNDLPEKLKEAVNKSYNYKEIASDDMRYGNYSYTLYAWLRCGVCQSYKTKELELSLFPYFFGSDETI